MSQQKRGYRVAGIAVIVIVVLGASLYQIARNASTDAPGVPEPAPAPEERRQGPGEAFEATGRILPIPEAPDMPINLWEAPYGAPPTGRGRVVGQAGPGAAVKIGRRAWHPDEERYYYYIVSTSPRGWVPESMVELDEGAQ